MKELLDHGTDVNASFGHLQTRPLQWAVWLRQLDIVRLLLQRGASQDSITAVGWNVPYFCWPRLEPRQPLMLDFLNLLAEDSYQDLEVTDTEGATVLHRVAAYGRPEEVERLIALGAKPEQVALPLRWNAIHHAVFYGNHATFKTLLRHYADVASLTDERGWTLLHVAASAALPAGDDNDQTVRDLLDLGADPQAISKPFKSHMPDSLFGKACTPQDVAAARSSEREAQFLATLRAHELGQDLDFWEAEKFLVSAA